MTNDFDAVLDQAEGQTPAPQPQAGSSPNFSTEVPDIRQTFMGQKESQKNLLVSQQIQSLQRIVQQTMADLCMDNWAESQIESLKGLLNPERFTDRDWETWQTELLPTTQQVLGDLDPQAALLIQMGAVLRLMVEEVQHTRSGTYSYTPALQGGKPALLLGQGQ